jgi:hypothetical protein
MEEKLEEKLEELEEELEKEDILSLLLTSTKLLFSMICEGGDMLFNLFTIYSFTVYYFSTICGGGDTLPLFVFLS